MMKSPRYAICMTATISLTIILEDRRPIRYTKMPRTERIIETVERIFCR